VAEEGDLVQFGGISSPDYLRPIYANYANVGLTPHDFRLTFALLKSPRPGDEQEQVAAEGVLHPEAVADIIVPVNLVQGLITALRSSLEQHLNQYGVPGLTDPGGEDS